MLEQSTIFNRHPTIRIARIAGEHQCLIVDDVLLEPESFVQFATEHHAAFEKVGYNFYPGIQYRMPPEINSKLGDFFMTHARTLLNARRVLRHHCRLSIVTLPPEALSPPQWICHRDSQNLEENQCIAASVLYLFKDADLGGTNFYRPRKSDLETRQLVHDSNALSAEAFTQKYGVSAGYFTASNDFFELIGNIPARWNRMIFYDGSLFHSGDIRHPEKLSADPNKGRLTLNGFFTCTKRAA